MAKLSILAGATSVTVNLFIQDSSSTTGAGLTGLAYNTASLTCYYALPQAAAAAITLATLAAATSAWSSGGFKEIDATNMPGWYRFDIPNAAIASGRFSSIHFKGATNMAPLPLEIELTAVNNQSATAFMTSVATVTTVTNQLTAAQIATGVWQDTTAGDFTTALSVGKSIMNGVSLGTGLTVAAVSGAVGSVTGAVGSVTGAVGSVTARVTANADQLAGQTITAAAGVTFPTSVASPTNITAGTITTVTNLTNAPTAGDLTATMKTSVTTAATAATPTAAAVTGAVGSVTGNVGGNVVGTVASVVGAVGSVTGLTASDVGAIKTTIGTAGAGLTNLGDTRIANLDATVSSRGTSTYAGGAVASVTGSVGSVTAGVTVTTNNDKTGYGLSGAAVQAIWDALTSALTTVGSIGKKLADWTIGTAQTGDSFARLGAPAGASVSADMAAVKADTAAVKAKTDNLPAAPAAVGDIPTSATVAGAVWDITMASHLTAGSTGNALNAAGAAGDPWSTALPGSYGAGTAGKIVGDNINASILAVKAKTDNLPPDPADASDIAGSFGTVNSTLTTIAGYIDTEITDIQSRLPAALVGGRMDTSVGAMAANVMTAAAAAADLTTELQSGLATAAALAVVSGYVDTEVAAIKAVTDALPNGGALTSLQADLDDIQTRLPAALIGGRMDANMGAISSSATAADNLKAGATALVVSTCAVGCTTTSIVTNLTEATSDHYNGRVITFTSGALAGQSTSISAYNGATKTLTVVALTEAAANTDSFVIS